LHRAALKLRIRLVVLPIKYTTLTQMALLLLPMVDWLSILSLQAEVLVAVHQMATVAAAAEREAC